MIHHDSDNIINCLIDGGEKKWLLLPTEFKHAGLGFQWTAAGGFIGSDASPVDPNRLDLRQFPAFQHVPWESVTMQPGDCLYLPAQYLHQVRTDHHRSMALSIMFLKEASFPYDAEGCDQPLPPMGTTTMDKLDFMWRYEGSGPVLMGYIRIYRYLYLYRKRSTGSTTVRYSTTYS